MSSGWIKVGENKDDLIECAVLPSPPLRNLKILTFSKVYSVHNLLCCLCFYLYSVEEKEML